MFSRVFFFPFFSFLTLDDLRTVYILTGWSSLQAIISRLWSNANVFVEWHRGSRRRKERGWQIVPFGSVRFDSLLLFYSPLEESWRGKGRTTQRVFSGRNRRSQIADVTTKVASRHVARATYLFGRVWSCIDSPRASSEPTYRHVGYRTDDKFNPPLRTNFADLHRADPCAQIAVDLR